MRTARSHGVSVTQKSWAEVCLVVLAFALVLGLVGLAAFDGNEHEAQAKTVEPVTYIADVDISAPLDR